jgi:hemoglobin
MAELALEMTALESMGDEAVEASISACVRDFYAKARRDPLLGPVFAAKVDDWDLHLRVVADFWSSVLLKTTRYSSHPYLVHTTLEIAPAHIDRWLELFAETAAAILPPAHAEAALARARLMGDSFRVGLFPVAGPDAGPSRHP